jgi:hypothetical protein
LRDWERLFGRALEVADAAQRHAGSRPLAWTLGGGAVLMRRYRHRRSASVDLFVRDPGMLANISPRGNEAVRALSADYAEQPTTVKIYFPEGEVAYLGCGLLTPDPLRRETILGRPVLVETPAEVLAKKLWHRAAALTARDLFDLAAVAAMEPAALREVGAALRVHRVALLERLRQHGDELREDFGGLEPWEFKAGFDECASALRAALSSRALPPIIEQPCAPYRTELPAQPPARGCPGAAGDTRARLGCAGRRRGDAGGGFRLTAGSTEDQRQCGAQPNGADVARANPSLPSRKPPPLHLIAEKSFSSAGTRDCWTVR